MARRKVAEPEPVLDVITPAQQTFIEHLLAGKSISQAALLSGIRRRAAAFWLAEPEHPVTLEYELQRAQQQAQQQQVLQTRMANLHELALKAMEDALAETSPPGIRLAAAKFLYEKQLAPLCQVQAAREPLSLVDDVIKEVKDREWFQTYDEVKLRLVIDD